jgi:phospholipase D
MKINTIKSRTIAPHSLFLIILVAFGAGYTTKEFVVADHKPQLPKQSYQQLHPKEERISVCFTPNKQCRTQIIDEINKAKRSIYVQGYSFTDQGIAKALVDAAQRGVSVQVLLDKSNIIDKRSAKDIIIQNNLPIRFDSPPGIAHNKVMVIDHSIVISGSYNFSAAAYTRNTENLLILHHPDLAEKYIQNWQRRWKLSKERRCPRG